MKPNVAAVPRPEWSPLPYEGCVGVDGKMLVREEDVFVAMLRFRPGGTIHEHPGPNDTVVVCLEGDGYTSVAGKAAALAAGRRVHWPKGVPHRLWTEGSAMKTLMVERPLAHAQSAGPAGTPFDFAGYRTAVEARDVTAWIEFFTEDAEWLEYRSHDPPRSPNVMSGRAAIRDFLEGVAREPLELRVSHEVLAERRVAHRLSVSLADGRRMIEAVNLELDEAGKIVEQTEVEAWYRG